MSAEPAAAAVAPAVRAPGAQPAAPAARCENCGAPVSACYCSACGQRVEPPVHSLWHFAKLACEDLTHADSRLWRTLTALLFKPGYLTREFLSGRRARYLPPVRLYLVLSPARPGESPQQRTERLCRNASYDGPWQKQIAPLVPAVCRQGRALTFAKLLPLSLFYLVSSALMLAVTTVYSALTL
jgi:Protein of unknown function (DUF3667)